MSTAGLPPYPVRNELTSFRRLLCQIFQRPSATRSGDSPRREEAYLRAASDGADAVGGYIQEHHLPQELVADNETADLVVMRPRH
jgi:hypothetical protein